MRMWTRYLCDVIDYVDVVVDSLVRHVLSTLVAGRR